LLSSDEVIPEKVLRFIAAQLGLHERLLEAQADRNAWREMAQKRRSWWPWG
jgi:hypothetical protein